MVNEQLINIVLSYDDHPKPVLNGIVQLISDKVWTSKKYASEIVKLSGGTVDPSKVSHQRLKYIHLYLIQLIVSNQSISDPAPIVVFAELWNAALEKVDLLFVNHASVLAHEDGFVSDTQKLGGLSKRERAIEIYIENHNPDDQAASAVVIKQAYMSELDMSKGGATTYYYKTKKDQAGV